MLLCNSSFLVISWLVRNPPPCDSLFFLSLMLSLNVCLSLSTPPTFFLSFLLSRLMGDSSCVSQSVSSSDALSQLKAFSTSSIIWLHPFGDSKLSTAFYKYLSSPVTVVLQHYGWTGNSNGQRQCCTQCSGHSSTNVSPLKAFCAVISPVCVRTARWESRGQGLAIRSGHGPKRLVKAYGCSGDAGLFERVSSKKSNNMSHFS